MKIKSSKTEILTVFLLAIITGIIFGYCFYPQSGIDPNILSDTSVHVDWARGLITGGEYPDKIKTYPFTYIIIGILGKILNSYPLGATLFAILGGMITFFFQLYFLRWILDDKIDTPRLLYLADIFAFCTSFLWPLTIHMGRLSLHGLYQSSFATAPPHNLTQLSVKISALLSLMFFYRIFLFQNDLKKQNRSIFLFSVFLILSVLFKPSFYQCFAPAGVVWTIAFFLMYRKKEVFISCVKVAIAYIPATIWMVYGMSINVNKMEISPFEGITMFLNGTPLVVAIIKAIVFPLILGCYLVIKKRFELLYVLGLITYSFGLLEFILFIEPAERQSLNMAWGYQLGMYIFFLVSIAVFMKIFPKLNIAERIIGSGLIFAHTLIGIRAFMIWPSLFYILQIS